MSEALVAFIDAMHAAGVVPAEPIADKLGPEKIRFQVEGDRKGRKNGWARFYPDGVPGGSFGSYKTQLAMRWRFNDNRVLSADERRRLANECRENERRRAAERETAQRAVAERCGAEWTPAGPVDPMHGYLVAKRIPGEGLRQVGDMLLVPMFDDSGQLWNLQRIKPDGAKLYTKGGKASGLHMLIGEIGDHVVVAEGYGNGAVVRRATGYPVAVAFTWHNLTHVACLMRQRAPDAEIIIAADDDAHLVDHPNIKRNIGIEAAEVAASAVGGRVAVPPRKAA